MVHFLSRVGEVCESAQMRKMARLQWMNIVSSVVVSQSVLLAAVFGWVVVERMGAIAISFVVIWLSVRILHHSLEEIMDRSTDKASISRIVAAAGLVDNVERIEWVRTRHLGHGLCVDLRVGIDGNHTMRQADSIAADIRERLRREMKGLAYVTVDCYPL